MVGNIRGEISRLDLRNTHELYTLSISCDSQQKKEETVYVYADHLLGWTNTNQGDGIELGPRMFPILSERIYIVICAG